MEIAQYHRQAFILILSCSTAPVQANRKRNSVIMGMYFMVLPLFYHLRGI